MSSPAWWDKTLTLYHCIEDSVTHTVTWQRSILNNCFWKQTISQPQTQLSTTSECSTIVRIPSADTSIDVGDLLVLGLVEDEIDEYTSGQRASDLLARYKDRALKIQSIVDNNQALVDCPHLRIGGI